MSEAGVQSDGDSADATQAQMTHEKAYEKAHEVRRVTALVVGAGPAGLMAAQVLADAGVAVEVFDAMPSAGRKFLLAGKGGLNLTHSEPMPAFLSRYHGAGDGMDSTLLARRMRTWLEALSPQALRDWAQSLGISTFVGSSGRVFPSEMKAAPLLRAWMHRLRQQGVRFHTRSRWVGWSSAEPQVWHFETPQGSLAVQADAGLLALGGASWARLGSDGAWVPTMQGQGVAVENLQPANCGFEVDPTWSPLLRERFGGAPLKGVRLLVPGDGDPATTAPAFQRLGECVLTTYGLEGSLIYAAGRSIRQALSQHGRVTVYLDLLPALALARVQREVAHPRGSRSLGSHLKSRLNLEGVKAALLQEVMHRPDGAAPIPASGRQPEFIAQTLKALPITLARPRPLDEAISTAGGVAMAALNDDLMLKAMPGVFCAGEMLDWEAPTGGYLLQASFASGRWAGQAMVRFLSPA